ncbi:cytochrome b ascorbate-dependent protein 3 [Podospora fimiseda]|uniref:Cytochrome b ascorbate-dependent protein 3 n=1 Tax=Podospora fimiseda TaxID=252190 RepID=A0AAN7BS42_9PEZI|nr:cytochrome b ascorbate-dependent protein 3 [Podospora fimiseda]
MTSSTNNDDHRTYAEVVDNRPHHSPSPSPQTNNNNNNSFSHPEQSEYEPLLGRPGSALQSPNSPMYKNLYLGTGFLALTGLLLLPISLIGVVSTHRVLPLVSPHLLLQSFATSILVAAILLLQPTSLSNAQAKKQAAKLHAFLQVLSFLLFTAGVAIIETNKHVNNMPHFHSAHAAFGVITYFILVVQYLFGFTIYVTPQVWGQGGERAKSLYKWHRYVGYLLLILVLVTVSAANWTDYVRKALHVPKFVLPLAAGLIAVGVFPRVQKNKFGYVRVR